MTCVRCSDSAQTYKTTVSFALNFLALNQSQLHASVLALAMSLICGSRPTVLKSVSRSRCVNVAAMAHPTGTKAAFAASVTAAALTLVGGSLAVCWPPLAASSCSLMKQLLHLFTLLRVCCPPCPAAVQSCAGHGQPPAVQPYGRAGRRPCGQGPEQAGQPRPSSGCQGARCGGPVP